MAADPANTDIDQTPFVEPCEIASSGETLNGWLISPAARPQRLGVVLAHGFPSSTGASLVGPMRSLGERMARSMGLITLAFGCRGVEGSTGSFSLDGWLRDLLAAIEFLADNPQVDRVALVGFGTGGALGICAAQQYPELALAAALGAPADFDDWAKNPLELLRYGRELNVIAATAFDDRFQEWSNELQQHKAVDSAEQLQDTPLLVMHGSEDDVVPALDARAIAESHGVADLRIIAGSGHHLRHDPRAIAVLLGWLNRQAHDLGFVGTAD